MNNISQVLQSMQSDRELSSEKLESFRLYVRTVPASSEHYYQLHIRLINCEMSQARYDNALDLTSMLLAEYPQNARLYDLRSEIQTHLGDIESACSDALESLRISPMSPHCLNLALQHQLDFDIGEALPYILDHLSDVHIIIQLSLMFVIARYYDSLKEYSLAFETYHYANQKYLQSLNPIPSLDRRVILDLPCEIGCDLDRVTFSFSPVLITGVYRSGTSLLQSRLTTHHEICSAGESVFLPQHISRYLFNCALRRSTVDNACIHSLLLNYEQRLIDSVDPLRFIIDKEPENYLTMPWLVNHIKGIKCIHIQRNPYDTLWACFTTLFGYGIHWSYNLDTAVQYYLEYHTIMQRWMSIIPASSLCLIKYEALVNNPSSTIQQVTEFLGADYHDSMLDTTSKNIVMPTPSAINVNKPIFTSSIAKYKRYEQYFPKSFQKLHGIVSAYEATGDDPYYFTYPINSK